MDLSTFKERKSKEITYAMSRIEALNKKIENEIELRGNSSPRIGVFQEGISRFFQQLLNLKLEQAFARDDTPADLAERKDVLRNYSDKVSKVLSDNLHLKFHGTSIGSAAQIIKSGEISSSVDRIGAQTSADIDGQFSATDKKDLYLSIQDYTHLDDVYMPGGCLFVMLPRSVEEDKMSRLLMMQNVDFKSNPSQLYAIVTTTENKNMVAGWCKDNGITAPVVTFEESLQKMERDSQAIDQVVEVMGDKINLSNHIDIMSAIEVAPLLKTIGKDGIGEMLNSIQADKMSDVPVKDTELLL